MLQVEKTKIMEFEKVTKESSIYNNLPEFYRAKFESRPSVGSLIYTEVWLPIEWNGIFIGTGNSGMAGNIDYNALAMYVRDGYAVANTDMGTSRGRDSGINNSDVWKDFGWRATHIMTIIGKEIVWNFYGKKPRYSYFVGGSTGGQQALSEAQRFPEDYDGIIAVAPANNRTMLHTYFLWNHRWLRKDGRGIFSSEEVKKISDCAALFYQMKGDGEPGDNFVSFPSGKTEDIEEFIRFLKTCTEFNKEQLDALKRVYIGPLNPVTGKRIYNGMPIGSEAMRAGGILECQSDESPHIYPFLWVFGNDYDSSMFDFNEDLDKINSSLAEDLNANDSNLSEFADRNGKIIMYMGSADPCVPYPDALNYYDRVIEKLGEYTMVSYFFRCFLMPGMSHNNEGNGTNEVWADAGGRRVLNVLRDWREKGIAPECLKGVSFIGKQHNKEIRFIRDVYPCRSKKSVGDFVYPACDDIYLG